VALILTLDASVYVTAAVPTEPAHADCRRLIRQVRSQGLPLVQPTLLLPEIAGAVSRRLNDPDLARATARSLRRARHVTLVPLDPTVAEQAVELAAARHLRGSDAVYAAVALRFGGALVTLDREQAARAQAVVRTLTPAEALSEPELSRTPPPA
jgi:predicted nucleic acid-binding protein